MKRLYIEVLMPLTGALVGGSAYEFTGKGLASCILAVGIYCFLRTFQQLLPMK